MQVSIESNSIKKALPKQQSLFKSLKGHDFLG